MQLVIKKKNVKTNLQGQNFSITASPKAFQILSDKLYTNKIKAVIRELSTNAYDSHVEAGKEREPFEVHLPNSLEPYFYVKDYGTGMSEEKVLSLYSSYFGSDKTESNDFVGVLGLGSKSPFAYKESFTVESVYNGEKKIYACYLNEENIPCISKVTEMSTSEHNGVKVQVEVDKGDFYMWEANAKEVFRPFRIKPRVIGGEGDFAPLEYPKDAIFKGSDWRIYKGRYNNGLIAVQGNVEYRVDSLSKSGLISDSNLLNNELKTIITHFLRSLLIVIEFPIGKLDIAPSREALSLDTRTVNNLILKLKEIVKKVQDEIQEEYFSDNKTLLEVIRSYYTIVSKVDFFRDFINRNVWYKGKPLQKALEIDNSDDRKKIKFFKVQKKGSFYDTYEDRVVLKSSVLNSFISYSEIGSPKTKIFINDENNPNSGIYKLKQNMRQYNFHALVIPEDYIQKLGVDGELNKISELKYIRKPGRERSKTDSSATENKDSNRFYTILHNCDGINKSFTYKELLESDIYKNNSQLYYVIRYRNSYKDVRDENRRVPNLKLDILKSLEVLNDSIPIFVINGYEINTKRFKKLTKFKPFFKSIEVLLKEKFNSSKAIKQYGYTSFLMHHDKSLSYIERKLVTILEIVDDCDKKVFESDKDVKELINRKKGKGSIPEIERDLKNLKKIIYDFEYSVDEFDVLNNKKLSEMFIKTSDLLKKVEDKYPILKIVDKDSIEDYYGVGIKEENVKILIDLLKNYQ